ncbi:MAG TPA: hypothetical protein VFV37_00360, partial [Luteibaculaceae bacterium]|nr:hypothetical protein [Luteibaculaceae bacterium]
MSKRLSPDPLMVDPAKLDNYDRYAYAYNNPIRYLDPSGYAQVGSYHHRPNTLSSYDYTITRAYYTAFLEAVHAAEAENYAYIRVIGHFKKTTMNPYKDKDLRKFIESIPQEEVDRQTRLQEENNARVYKEFTDGLKIGKCFLCGGQMNSFVEGRPCFHWFTYPTGIKKKHFENYLKNPIGFFQLDSYFRWLANTEKPIANINDLKDETSSTSYLETTYKYKNIEWAFSIGHTDKEGHPNAQVG